jgi:hypothetical protein
VGDRFVRVAAALESGPWPTAPFTDFAPLPEEAGALLLEEDAGTLLLEEDTGVREEDAGAPLLAPEAPVKMGGGPSFVSSAKVRLGEPAVLVCGVMVTSVSPAHSVTAMTTSRPPGAA